MVGVNEHDVQPVHLRHVHAGVPEVRRQDVLRLRSGAARRQFPPPLGLQVGVGQQPDQRVCDFLSVLSVQHTEQ